MSHDTMHQARFVRGEGEDVIVSVPGRFPLPPDVKVFSRSHERYMLSEGFTLACRHCTAKVHFNKGANPTHGENASGRIPHFVTNPGETHGDACGWERDARKASQTAIDRTIGYKLHLNTGDLPANAAYKRDEDGRMHAADPRLLRREPVPVHDVRDIVRLLKNGDPARIRDSLVVHRGFVVPWQEFFLRTNRNAGGLQARFHEAVLNIRSGDPRPALMELNVPKPYYPPRYSREPLTVHATRIFLPGLEDGRDQLAIPCAVLQNRDNTLVTHAFAEAGRYLALGYVRRKTIDTPRDRVHFLDMDITDPAQVVKCDIASLRR